jgi:outer membrane biosynthesis protein TonB
MNEVRRSDGNANAVSLDELLARRVATHWSEAVAIVDELCAVLIADGRADVRVPATGDILISGAGTVIVRPGAAGHREISQLGRTLHALLVPANTPPPLRLFVSTAISSNTHHSVQAFSEALAYYARPGRTEMIQAVYQHYLATPVIDAPSASEPPAQPDQETETHEPRRRRVPAWAIAATVVLVAAAAAGLWVRIGTRRGDASSAGLGNLVVRATSAVEKLSAEVREKLHLGSTAPTQEEPREPASTVRGHVRAKSATQRVLIARRALVGPLSGAALAAPSVSRTDSIPLASAMAAPAAAPTTAGAYVTRETVRAYTPERLQVYSSSASDVEPPVALSSQLPARSMLHGSYATNTLELLVDEDGSVQQVKLISPLRRIADVMFLSGVKTWKFQPALKDGQPVKYRLVLNWTVAPS